MKFQNLIFLIVVLFACQPKKQTNEFVSFKSQKEALAWMDSVKYGMFVHWGLYAVPAGEWKGMKVPGISEWIMSTAQIPVKEYEQLGKQFNPVDFNAEKWVETIKEAGMKYLIITAKHHDGFAMFDSPSSKYDIVDATPYGKDPIKELSEACRKHGIRLGFYYSHDQDWHHPGGSGNSWEHEYDEEKFKAYFEEKVKPQVTELLTQYGDIFVIWFDTPRTIKPEQSKELTDLVHKLQPTCLVSNRVGHGMGDYKGFGDNQVPAGVVEGVWETCGTTNDSWGYKRSDNNWKSPELLKQLLTNIVSKGGVYLLNVGPDERGNLPEKAVANLKEVGKWLKTNGEAVSGANPSPLGKEYDWGAITQKENKLYLHLFELPANRILSINGFNTQVAKAYYLADKKQVPFSLKESVLKLDLNTLDQELSPFVPVVVVEIEGDIIPDSTLRSDLNGIISLPAHRAKLYLTDGSKMAVEGGGITERYFNPEDFMDWEFVVDTPGRYNIEVICPVSHWSGWITGNVVSVKFEDELFTKELEDGYRLENLNTLTWQDTPNHFGTINFEKPGTYKLTFKPQKINPFRSQGLRIRSIQLVPEGVDFKELNKKKIVEPLEVIADEREAFLKVLKVKAKETEF